ncbi:hypothetical protein L2719_00830 [Shewanella schlegeliana]|uniref:Uncharacterized protein n=1 Tax=Shewanella schlegeliana TaxID=190308 RepID=A0ABS1SX01_9GAMM|nr:hypothetical protein [Shewanella schlegeliana]MBL4912424.1 hypothetical protein [Shewanella schlegeliana]MCL1108106.1 hypothetical protein [Shewanella schlegeliana]GIU21808.1 hypothetical protein TUM4433_01640 [Shewanella schlegeliana]
MAEFLSTNADSESAKIIAPSYDSVSLDSEYLSTENLAADDDSDWGLHWNMEPQQWQLDIKHDSKQGNDIQYLVCCETESKFSLYFECTKVTSASQFTSLFFSTWAQTQRGYSERYLNLPEDDEINEMLNTIESLKRHYHWYLRELEDGIALTNHFEAVYNASFEPITAAQQDSEELAEQTVFKICQDWLNLTERPTEFGEMLAPAEDLDMRLTMLAAM